MNILHGLSSSPYGRNTDIILLHLRRVPIDDFFPTDFALRQIAAVNKKHDES